ncbi:MAG: xanthine dehydrogenase family protein molybdopterin-binding subunit [Chloroflexi bacterium]|nr:xanthine dehydrogenase family protein molybdopterin-binding subunit [Chloroflexota bacterium]
MTTTTAPLPKLLGQPVRRREDARLLTGTATYVDDLQLPGMLYLHVVRSPYAHARILSIDPAAALAQPDVVAVYTAADFADAVKAPLPLEISLDPFDNVHVMERGPLATDRARYVGDPVAIVVAGTRYGARDAADLVAVDYEPLPVVVDPERAMDPDAPLLYDAWGTNVGLTQSLACGDPDGAFAAAPRAVRFRIHNQRVLPAAMECRGCLADWRPARPGDEGELTIWSSTQIPHGLRTRLAVILDLPENKIRAIAPEVGGGFGNKVDIAPEEVAASIVAMRLGRPVKWSETRSENFLAAAHARDQIDVVEAAVEPNGKVTALSVTAICDLGGYYQYVNPVMGMLTGMMLPGTYDIPNCRYELRSVMTNKTPVGAYRGAGRPEATFLLECLMDRVAHELGLDPAEVRRVNFVPKDRFPHKTPFGADYDSGDYELALNAALDAAGYARLREEQAQARAGGRLVGIGLAAYVEVCGPGPWESATARVEPTGTVTIYTGLSPHGQGTATSLAQIVGDTLGVPIDRIVVEHGDTAKTATGVGTFGSRGAAVGGGAMAITAGHLREKVLRIAAHLLEASAEDIELQDGLWTVAGTDRARTLREIAQAAYGGNVPAGDEPGLESTRFFKPTGSVYPFGVHIAVVEIDRETGRVDWQRFLAVDDVGNVINPLLLDGQRHGGIVQGYGQAFCERVAYDDEGQLITGTMGDYAMPTAHGLPPFELHRTVTLTDRNPLGVKGVGEAGTIGSTPTLRSAVLDALLPLGIRDFDMPATSGRVWQAIQAAGKK